MDWERANVAGIIPNHFIYRFIQNHMSQEYTSETVILKTDYRLTN